MGTNTQVGYSPLYFSFLVGLCGNATFATLTNSAVAFSIFPIIALALALYNGYKIYMKTELESDINKASIALFVLGILSYTAFVRMEHPELGSNLLPLLIILGVGAWVAKTLGVFASITNRKKEA